MDATETSPNSWRLRASQLMVTPGWVAANSAAVATRGARPRSCFQVRPRSVGTLNDLFRLEGGDFVVAVAQLLQDFGGVLADQRRALHLRGRAAELDGRLDGPERTRFGVLEGRDGAVVHHLRIALH